MKDDAGCIIIVVIVGLAAFLVGILVLHGVCLRRGYIACLSDIQNNRPMRYVLKKQVDGETRWVKNTEVKKED